MKLSDTFKVTINEAIKRLKVPSFTELLKNTQEEFMRNVRQAGLSASIEPWGLIKKELESGVFDAKNFVSILPEFISVGRLRLEDQQEQGPNFQEINSYLTQTYLPALVRFRQSSGILFVGGDKQAGVMNAQLVILRLLLTVHPRLVNLTLIDTQSLGRSVKLLTHLKDAINCTLISDSQSIEQEFNKLRDIVSERNSKVLTKFDWLYEYNDHHRETPEPYHVVLLADGLCLLDDKTQKILTHLLSDQNASHAGIYFIICSKEVASNMGTMSVVIKEQDSALELYQSEWIDTRKQGQQAILHIENEKVDPEVIQALQTAIHNRACIVRVPSVNVAIVQDQWWTKDSSRGIRIPIGKSGADVQDFVLGEDRIVHNALVGGAVGTGKSVLLHTIISNVACLYSPAEIRLHLLDYKEGTEFNSYRNLPHLESLSIGPSAEFGFDVLQELQKEISRRGELFKKCSASKMEDYRKATQECLPRHLLVIDEFQVLLMDNSKGDEASQLLEDIVRRGRAFGINVILSTQSLRGCNLSNPTKSNLGLRVCLRLPENDCLDFLGYGNTAPSNFDRPGTALYNEKEGTISGNQLFQVSFIETNAVLSLVDKLAEKAKKMALNIGSPIIYDADSYVSAKDLINEVGEGNIVLGRKVGLKGVPVFFNPASNDFRSMLVVGNNEKIKPVYESLTKQFSNSNWQLQIVTDTPCAKFEITYEEAHQQWQRHLNMEMVESDSKKQKTVYLLLDPQQSCSMRSDDEGGIKSTLTALFLNPIPHSLKFVINTRSYSALRDSGIMDVLSAFSHFVFLEEKALKEHNGVFASLDSKNAWIESDYEPEGFKIRVAAFY